MAASRLHPSQVWKAIETYLKMAYQGPLPTAIRSRLEVLKCLPEEDFYQSELLEREPKDKPTRYSVRLGNQFYPHMKLTIDRRPDKNGYLFRADTHDRHCCPAPGSREYNMFCGLMEKNQKLAEAIEAAWAEQGLPTFKTYLRDDLARRMQAAKEQKEQGAPSNEPGAP